MYAERAIYMLGVWLLLAVAASAAAVSDVHVLVVGIDKYPAFGELATARQDAKAVAAAFAATAVPAANVVLMTDDAAEAALRPTRANLQAKVQALLDGMEPGDTLVFCFFGHGTEGSGGASAVLVPQDGLGEGGLPLDWLRTTAKAARGRNLLLVLDVVHTGTNAVGVSRGAAALAAPEFMFLLSCAPEQRSTADAENRQTQFGRALARAVADLGRQAPTRVSAGELYAGVLRVLRGATGAGTELRPQLLGDPAGKLQVLPADPRAAATVANDWQARPLHGFPWTVASLKMEFVAIKPGTYARGSLTGLKDEKPQQQVTITYDFWAGRTEVTQAQYRSLTGKNPSQHQGDALPVHNVSWQEAQAFCVQLTVVQKQEQRLAAGYVYRLPTEAEWEYVCRAGSGGDYGFGDDLSLLSAYANFGGVVQVPGDTPEQKVEARDPFPELAPVGSLKANEWGLHDVHGNVWEWCHDWYDSYLKQPLQDDAGPNVGFVRVFRGGSWRHAATTARAATRGNRTPEYASDTVGFRIVLAPAIGDVVRERDPGR